MADSGVEGTREIPGLRPSLRIASQCRWAWTVASTWKVMRSAPASAKGAIRDSGSTVMRWTSKGSVEQPRRSATILGPKLRFGTNRPSMTSRWAQSAPEREMDSTAAPMAEKSAARREGATRGTFIGATVAWRGLPRNEARRAGRQAGSPQSLRNACRRGVECFQIDQGFPFSIGLFHIRKPSSRCPGTIHRLPGRGLRYRSALTCGWRPHQARVAHPARLEVSS